MQTGECFEVEKYAINLINRQKAEIEALQKKVEELSEVLSDTIRIRYAECKAEAIKEFADNLCKGRVSNDPVVIAVKVELEMMKGAMPEEDKNSLPESTRQTVLDSFMKGSED